MYDNHKLFRMRLLISAYYDGLNDNFDNQKPNELLRLNERTADE